MSESTSRSSSRVSPEQLDILLTFMEEHLDFARGKQSIYSRFSSCKLWRLLTERLNAAASGAGGSKKSPDKWCRYWADMKYRARKRTFNASGDMNQVEERMKNILGNCEASNSTKYKLDSFNSRTGEMDEDVSEGSDADTPISTEEILAEAAMRSALAAEKQAEAMTQAVDLLRDIVTLLKPSPIPPPPLHHHHPNQQQPHPTHHRL